MRTQEGWRIKKVLREGSVGPHGHREDEKKKKKGITLELFCISAST